MSIAFLSMLAHRVEIIEGMVKHKISFTLQPETYYYTGTSAPEVEYVNCNVLRRESCLDSFEC